MKDGSIKKNDKVYIKLQKHLNNQAVGFPATKSGVEIKILKHIFTHEEAEIGSFLSYKFEPLKIIFGRVGHLVGSPEELKKILDRIQKKGGIESKRKKGRFGKLMLKGKLFLDAFRTGQTHLLKP